MTCQAQLERPCDSSLYAISFAGQHVWLDGQGALFWPDQSLLVVSDLHLEKGSFFRQQAYAVPGYDTRDTLERLASLIERYQPQTLVCLGDSFHDRGAGARLEVEDYTKLCALIATVKRWVWVLGNHDPALPEGVPGEAREDFTCAGVQLSHEPVAGDVLQLFGHFHPKHTLRRFGQKIKGRCFLVGQRRLLMPAFGSYTGGLDVGDQAIASLFEAQEAQRYLLYRNRVWAV